MLYFRGMRIWALLLAIIIACSAVMPAHVLARPQQHDCCHKPPKSAAHKPKKSGTDCCDNGVCNPFLPCSCCAFLIQKGMSLRTALSFPAAADYQRPRDASLQPSFVGSCFHPPELPAA